MINVRALRQDQEQFMGIIAGLENLAKKAVGFSGLRKNAQAIGAVAVSLTTIQKPGREETFEEAMTRLNLTPQDIQNREREFKRLVIVFCLLGVGVLAYFVYSVTQKALIASLGSMGIFFFIVAHVFRYHFWLFQIRQKRLGCTFKEWFRYLIGKNV